MEQEDFGFLALAFRQKYIKRWNLMRSALDEDLAQHSSQTAMIAHALALIGNEKYGKSYSPERAALIALFHDISEVFTGDMPTPVKYATDEMRDNCARLEVRAKNQLLSRMPEQFQGHYQPLLFSHEFEESKLVKIADKLCAFIKCSEEINSGNGEFSKAYHTIEKQLDSFDSPELDYFREKCLPFFNKTIDEI